MNTENTEFYEEDEYCSHRHNFSALNYIKIPEPTLEELKKREVMKLLPLKYELLFNGSYDMLYEAFLEGKDLDKEYQDLKGWLDFM